MLGNGSFCIGIGANPIASFGYDGASTSLGAARNAPAILKVESEAAQCASSAHARLCATRIGGPASLPDVVSPVWVLAKRR